MPKSAEQRAEDNARVRELRLGLVCYGGVSLAIYMHGITKEIQKLVVASRAFERNQERNTFPAETAEHAYWQALRTAWERSAADPSDRIATRVVVDVVAGTSAGGINGVILCKALAHNRSQDALRDLWFDRGDFKQLLGGSWWKAQWRVAKLGLTLLVNTKRARAPLDGDAMLGWLAKALVAMDASEAPYRPAGETCDSLMPEGHPLELRVTTTDYYGYRNSMLIEDPAMVAERRNRHLFRFGYRRGEEAKDQLGPAYNGALAFAARASSSFPGAFPPVNLKMAGEHGVADLNAFKEEFFKVYDLSGADAAHTYFIDGGVLNNYPFRPAIDAIFEARAETEVDRYLLYLQPDPGAEVVNPDGEEEPSLFGAVWAGLSSLAGAQPIYDELLAIRDFNERVRMIGEMLEQSQGYVATLLSKLAVSAQELKRQSRADLSAERIKIEERVRMEAGFLYQPYLEIRVRSVLDQLASVIANLCGYTEPESNLAYLIRFLVDRWARERTPRLVGQGADEQAQIDLLRAFDLGYTRRRLSFVKQEVNGLYERDSPTARAWGVERMRASLNRAKIALFDRIENLSGLMEGRGEPELLQIAEALRKLFPRDGLLAAFAAIPLEDLAARFLEQHRGEMESLFELAGRLLGAQKEAIHAGVYEDFQTITEEWIPEDRRAVLLRYFGFPFWDAMIYPLTHLSAAGELQPIKVVRLSPIDSTKLGKVPVGDKLKGVQLAHFGAFLRRDWRENDYLWGRLDAAERLIGLVLHPSSRSKVPPAGAQRYQAAEWEVKPVFEAILAEEKRSLKEIKPAVKKIAKRVGELADLPAGMA